MYTSGDSERIVGKWVNSKGKDFRKQIVISTKLFMPTGSTPNEKGYGKKHIIHAVQDSLERLQTPYIDLLFLHCYDPNANLEEALSTLNSLVKKGKILYIGVSNFSGFSFFLKNLI